MNRVFVGFGFGAIQGGLFLYEAFRSRTFERLVAAEIDADLVSAIRATGGRYQLNVATAHGVEQHEVTGIEIFNPCQPADREALVVAIAQAQELATALPSVQFYDRGDKAAVISLLADGLRLRRQQGKSLRSVIYTAENHNQAAEILVEKLLAQADFPAQLWSEQGQCLNTVIGKMSGVVTESAQIKRQNLAPLCDGITRCLLVEEFNRILISRVALPGFRRGIAVFEEKDDLLPFEEAKLYGHNATHALLGYLARLKGLRFMADARADQPLIQLARAAFLEESGRALCRRHAGVDALFTPAGYAAYVDDLLERMLNPHLRDAVDRVVRDPQRKLGWDDRLVGVMRVALSQHIQPERYARGAAAAMRMLAGQSAAAAAGLPGLWRDAGAPPAEAARIMEMIRAADALLEK